MLHWLRFAESVPECGDSWADTRDQFVILEISFDVFNRLSTKYYSSILFLYYGENWKKDERPLDFLINQSLKRLFKSNKMSIFQKCVEQFGFRLPVPRLCLQNPTKLFAIGNGRDNLFYTLFANNRTWCFSSFTASITFFPLWIIVLWLCSFDYLFFVVIMESYCAYGHVATSLDAILRPFT
jgi:hypothetical protein